MLTYKEFLALYDNGLFEEAEKELNRYGNILQDDKWSVPHGYHKGEHREKVYKYGKSKRLWTVCYHNGQVKSVGWSLK